MRRTPQQTIESLTGLVLWASAALLVVLGVLVLWGGA